MDSSNSSKENLLNSSISEGVIPNDSESTNNDSDMKIDKDNHSSFEHNNDFKTPDIIIDSKIEQKNCVSAENKDKNYCEMMPVKSDIKNDINADESEKEAREQTEMKRKRKNIR